MSVAPMITKLYMYSGAADTDEIDDFAEFAEYHIQSWPAALEIALSLLSSGRSENIDEHEQVWEAYQLTNRAKLIDALREHAPALDELDADTAAELRRIIDAEAPPVAPEVAAAAMTVGLSCLRWGGVIDDDDRLVEPEKLEPFVEYLQHTSVPEACGVFGDEGLA